MPIRILIAEDNPVVRSAMRSLLERVGSWEIVDVENGQEAIAKAQEVKPSLIILDLVMPVVDGLRAARQISQLLPHTPMLMHTMHWSLQVDLEAQKVGVRKVVSKANSSLLVSTVQQILSSEPSPSLTAANENISPDISLPNVAPVPPILEAGSAATSDKPEAPSAGETSDVPGNRFPN